MSSCTQAAMFHDSTGLPSPVPDVDFTVRSATVAREFTDSQDPCLPTSASSLPTRSPRTAPPASASRVGAEAYLLSAGAAVDVFGLRSNEIPGAVRQSVIQEYPRLGFKREFAGLLRVQAKQVPSWPRLVPAPLRPERPEHSALAFPD